MKSVCCTVRSMLHDICGRYLRPNLIWHSLKTISSSIQYEEWRNIDVHLMCLLSLCNTVVYFTFSIILNVSHRSSWSQKFGSDLCVCVQEHLLIVCELLKANLYEFQKFNREAGGEVYFTMPRLQVCWIEIFIDIWC